MAARRTRQKIAAKIETRNPGLFDFLRPGESYTSLVLGIVVVIIAAILLISFVRGRNAGTGGEMQGDSSSTQSPELSDGVKVVEGEKLYTVKAGDDLWKIAEKVYKDGYKWVEIAKVNSLTNPNFIHVGNMLKLPEVKESVGQKVISSEAAAQSVIQPITKTKIIGASYQVQKGDYLWDIAVRAYGDGFKWVEIAKTNNITNPDIIFTGTELRLPR